MKDSMILSNQSKQTDCAISQKLTNWIMEKIPEKCMNKNIRLDVFAMPSGNILFKITRSFPGSKTYHSIELNDIIRQSLLNLLGHIYVSEEKSRSRYPWNKFRYEMEAKNPVVFFKRAYDRDWFWLSRVSEDDPVFMALDKDTQEQIMSWPGLPESHSRPWQKRAAQQTIQRRIHGR